VVSVLGSGRRPGFKSQSWCCRVTVLGKLFTPIVPLSLSSKIGSSPLKDGRGNWQLQAWRKIVAAYHLGFMTHVTCRLIAKNQHQLWNPMLGNRIWATFTVLYSQNGIRIVTIDSMTSLRATYMVSPVPSWVLAVAWSCAYVCVVKWRWLPVTFSERTRVTFCWAVMLAAFTLLTWRLLHWQTKSSPRTSFCRSNGLLCLCLS